MKKLLLSGSFCMLLTLTLIECALAQDYIWTDDTGNHDFFDESNWIDQSTSSNPANGSLEPGQAIDKELLISDASHELAAGGIISLGTGSLSVDSASLVAVAISDGEVVIGNLGYIDLTDSAPISAGTQVDITSAVAWLRVTDVRPGGVLNTYLPQVTVDQSTAVYPDNIRLDNYYFSGTVIRKEDSLAAPLVVYDQSGLSGNSAHVPVYALHAGGGIPGGMNDDISSFVLKKGYMVTMAVNDDGTGLSKVFIASERDLVVSGMPENLLDDISFVRVIPWNWAEKKGFGSATVTGLNETWHYRWSNSGESNIDRECPPMSFGRSGSDDQGDIDLYVSKYKVTHLMGFNEVDHCDAQAGVNGFCDQDTAVAYYKNLMKAGLRLVSPSCREGAPFGWLEGFMQKATAQDIRIDVIGVHWYDWGSNPQSSPDANPQNVFNRFKNYLEDVHDLYGLPIWITEFNANPNRSAATNKAFMELALPYLDTLDYVERYAWFQPNGGAANFYTNRDGTGTITDFGIAYRDHESTTPAIPDEVLVVPNNLDNNPNPNVVRTFEAEDATLIGNAAINGCTNAYLSGGSSVSGVSGGSSNAIRFESLEVEETGIYEVEVSYIANLDRTLSYFANSDDPDTVSLLSSGGYCYQGTVPTIKSLFVALQSGVNTLTFFDAPVLDKIDLVLAGEIINEGPFEAENAILQGTAEVNSCANASGGEQVRYINGPGNGVSFEQIFVSSAGNYLVTLSYMSANPKNATVVANDSTYTFNLPSSGQWCYQSGSPADYTDTIHLSSGFNTITVSGDFQLDKISLDSGSGARKVTGLVNQIEELISEVLVYPNPLKSGESIRVEFGQNDSCIPSHVTLINMSGQVILDHNDISDSDFIIPTHGLNKGLYMLKVGSGSGQVIKRIIIE